MILKDILTEIINDQNTSNVSYKILSNYVYTFK